MTDPRVVHRITDPEGIRSLVHVPIVVDGEVFGVFGVNYVRQRDVGEEEQRLLLALAQRAALAIENARFYERAQRAAALEERQRLARELHDSVSQALYGMALGARTARTLLDRDPKRVAEPLDYVVALAEAGLAEMRALIFELRPESLAQEGLVAALGKQVEALRARHGLAVAADLGAEPELALEAKEALYRIAQEALHNTVKHARAGRVELQLTADAREIVLEVCDDGVGFDPGAAFPGHLGLESMRERAARLGGTVEIASAPGRGTRLRARLPGPPAR
jgi:signal transduction histidine kinase